MSGGLVVKAAYSCSGCGKRTGSATRRGPWSQIFGRATRFGSLQTTLGSGLIARR